MALYNEILVGRLNRALAKFTGIKGQAPSPQLASEITPGIPLFWGREMRVHEQWNTYAVAFNAPAGAAGNISMVRLRNPKGSNVIGVLERIVAITGAPDNILTAITIPDAGADLTTVARGTPLDSRTLQLNSFLIGSSKNNSVASVSSSAQLRLGCSSANLHTDVILTDVQELPLAPNSMFEIAAVTAAEALIVSFLWRERTLEEAEVLP